MRTATALDHLVGHSLTCRRHRTNLSWRRPTAYPCTSAEQYRAMRWAQRLKRVCGIEIETCAACGGKARVIASIEDSAVIGKILGRRRPAYVAARDPAPLPKAGSTMDRRRTPNP